MATTVTAPALEAEALDQLRADFRGDIVEPADPAYDELRGVFNGMFDRRPRGILRPAGTAGRLPGLGPGRLSGLPAALRDGRPPAAGLCAARSRLVHRQS